MVSCHPTGTALVPLFNGRADRFRSEPPSKTGLRRIFVALVVGSKESPTETSKAGGR